MPNSSARPSRWVIMSSRAASTRWSGITVPPPGRRGIRVNAIMPLTYLKRESRAFYEQNEKLMDTYRRLVPLGRLGTAEECADALDFLCSERASFINGQSL